MDEAQEKKIIVIKIKRKQKKQMSNAKGKSQQHLSIIIIIIIIREAFSFRVRYTQHDDVPERFLREYSVRGKEVGAGGKQRRNV